MIHDLKYIMATLNGISHFCISCEKTLKNKEKQIVLPCISSQIFRLSYLVSFPTFQRNTMFAFLLASCSFLPFLYRFCAALPRVCKAPRLCQIKPDFFLVVRLVLKSMCMKFGVNRSMFTGSRFDFTVSASRAGSNTSQTVISQARKVIERSVTTQNVQNNSLVNNNSQSSYTLTFYFIGQKPIFLAFFEQ